MVQEEHKNYGYCQHVQPGIETAVWKTRRAMKIVIVVAFLFDSHVEITAIFAPIKSLLLFQISSFLH